MVSTTRCTSWATLLSRSGDPIFPWKYLLTTMFVAVCDQSAGTSTSFCSKMTAPLSLPIAAVRDSHFVSSYGVLPASSFWVKYRGNVTPMREVTGRDFLVRLGSKSLILLPRSTVSCPICSPFYFRAKSVKSDNSVMMPQHIGARQGFYLYTVQYLA